VGSAHNASELEALKSAARQRLVDGQGEFDLGLDSTGIAGAPMEIVGSRAGHLWDVLCRTYELLGLGHAAAGDEVFRDLVLARIIEPTSKQDSLRVLAEAGVEPPAGVRKGHVAPSVVSGVCPPRRAGTGLAGALRREHAVLRDRCR
jgi:hypothetical protein